MAGVALALAGCTGVHISPPEMTGSIAETSTLDYAGSDHADWDAIRDRVATVPTGAEADRLEWTNAATGNSGTITRLTAPDGKDRPCRRLSTTIAAADGVRLFSAEMCRSVMDTWEFARISPAETAPDTRAAASLPPVPEPRSKPRTAKHI